MPEGLGYDPFRPGAGRNNPNAGERGGSVFAPPPGQGQQLLEEDEDAGRDFTLRRLATSGHVFITFVFGVISAVALYHATANGEQGHTDEYWKNHEGQKLGCERVLTWMVVSLVVDIVSIFALFVGEANASLNMILHQFICCGRLSIFISGLIIVYYSGVERGHCDKFLITWSLVLVWLNLLVLILSLVYMVAFSGWGSRSRSAQQRLRHQTEDLNGAAQRLRGQTEDAFQRQRDAARALERQFDPSRLWSQAELEAEKIRRNRPKSQWSESDWEAHRLMETQRKRFEGEYEERKLHAEDQAQRASSWLHSTLHAIGSACDCCFGKASEEEELLEIVLRPPSVCLVILVLILAYTFICGMLSFALDGTTLSIAVMILLAMVWFTECSGLPGTSHPAMRTYIPVGWVSMLAALVIGCLNFHANGSQYVNAVTGRQYEDVHPSEPASLYYDAGMVKFTNVTLDDSRAIGISSARHTYCVAPVLDTFGSVDPGADPPEIQFWAVGRDCCGRRQNFECDAASLSNVRGGIVVHQEEELITSKWFSPRTHSDEYMQSIQASLALFGGSTANPPILLRWVASPPEVLAQWFTRAILVWAISSVVNLILIIALCCSIHMFYRSAVLKAAIARGRIHSAKNAKQQRRGRDPFLLP